MKNIIISLSSAKHLECEPVIDGENMIHASPRIKEGKNQLQTSNIVSCSEILKRCNGDIEGTRIFIFCDAFSLHKESLLDVPTDRVVAIIDTHGIIHFQDYSMVKRK